MERYDYPLEEIPIEDVLEGKAKLPEGVEWYTYDNGFKWFRTNPSLLKKSQRNKDLAGDFLMRVVSEDFSLLKGLPKALLREDLYTKIRVGNYVVNNPKSSTLICPDWFNYSIIRISKIAIIFGYISGVGVRENHSCAYREVGWENQSFLQESIVGGVYDIFNKKEVENYCKAKDIELIPNFDSADPKIPIRIDLN